MWSAKDAALAERILKPEYLSPTFLGYMNDYNALNQAPIPASNIMGLNAAMIPIGVPLMWLRNTIVPQGYVLLDGTVVSQIVFNLLFELWGTSFNTGGEAADSFRLPDFRGRVPVGKGTHADVDTVGDNDGTALASRRPKHSHTVTGGSHTHTVTDPGHFHTVIYGGGAGTNPRLSPIYSTNPGTENTSSATTGITIASANAAPTVGVTTAPVDGPAYIVVNFITRYSVDASPQPVAVLAQPVGAESGAGSSEVPPAGKPGGTPSGGPAINRPTTPSDL